MLHWFNEKKSTFRSAKLSNLNDEDLDILEKNKIFKIIDLRDPVEIEKAPDNLSSNLLKKYINLPISANTLREWQMHITIVITKKTKQFTKML